jgi:uncharacterized protein
MNMSNKIILKTIKVSMEAELNSSGISSMIYDKLPIKARVNTWGDEIYFPIPVKTLNENSVSSVKIGDIAYWPPSNCFCIFFGKTPVSTENEIRPASEVTLLGKLSGNPEEWKAVKNGEEIIIEKT